VGAVSLLAAACYAPPSVSEEGAERIEATAGVGSAVLDDFAVSPSGDRILFARESQRPVAEEALDDLLGALGRFAILDRPGGRLRSVGVDEGLGPVVGERQGLAVGPLCWPETGDTVYLGISAGPAIAVDAAAPDPEWRLMARAAPPDAVGCPVGALWWRALQGEVGRFVVEDVDGRVRVESREDGRLLFEYGGVLTAPDAYLQDVRLAPGGDRLAVVVSRGLGSFSGAAELFVVSMADGDPPRRSLGGPVFHVRWAGRDALFAVSTLDGGPERAIYYWDLSPPAG
jgi:hypothetical protein